MAYAPFHYVATSDHRPLIVDINLKLLLDDYTPTLAQPQYRRLKSTIPKRVNIYVEKLSEKWHLHNMSLKVQQVDQLFNNDGITQPNIEKLIKLDNQMQQFFTFAENKCSSVDSSCITLFSKDYRKALKSRRHLKSLISTEMMKLSFKTYNDKIKKIVSELKQVNISIRNLKKHQVDFRNQHHDDCVQQAVRDNPDTKISSYIKQLKHIENQRRDSSQVDRTLNGAREGALSYVLIPSISEYTTEQQSSSGFNYKDMSTMWKRILPKNGKDIVSWDIVDHQKEVETLTLECMKLHFSQANNTPLTTDHWMNELLNPTVQQAILNGTYDLSQVPEPIKIFFQALKINHVNDDLPFHYPFHEFDQFVRDSTEKTSASPSGRHYGHFKVIQKYLPQILKDIHSIMTICMKYNVLIPRYCKTVTTLIAKEPGQPKIHRLRPLHLIEIELQAIAKSQWSRKLIRHAESKNLITSSQYGGRAGNQAQSAVLNKVLAFDSNNLYVRDYTSVDEDLKANFDRELSHLGAMEDQYYGVSTQQGAFLHNATSSQEFFIKTKFGISDGSYTFSKDLKVWGLGQGIGWSGSRWILTSSTITRAMEKHRYGLKLTSPDKSVFIQKILDMFADDTSQICNSFQESCLLEQTRQNLQLHSHLVFVTGGLIALDKCSFYHVQFKFDDDGNPRMLKISENSHDLMVRRTFDGPLEVIKQLDPNSEHITLGYFIAPTGCNIITIKKLTEIVTHWTTKIKSSNLSDRNTLLSYESVIKPKLTYRLVANSLTFEECDAIFRPVFEILLHACGIQRHMSRTLCRASHQFAGLGFTHLYDLHGQEKLKFFFMHLQRFDNTGKLIFILLQITQLYIGTEQFFMHLDYDKYNFSTPNSWVKHLWQYTDANDLSIDLTHEPTFQKQRKYDAFIMDLLHKHFEPADLFRINKIRLHLQVLVLSDITTLDGKTILPNINLGTSHRTSSYEWPKQPLVTKYLPLWKRACAILNTTLASKPLGEWTSLHQSFQWSATSDELYITNGTETYECVRFGRRKKYELITPEREYTFNHSADIYRYRDRLYLVSSAHIPSTHSNRNTFDYDTVIGDITLPHSLEKKIAKLIRRNRLIFGSDGSEDKGIGKFSWGMLDTNNLTGTLTMFQAPVHGDQDQVTALRAELFGLFACLHYVHHIVTKFNLKPSHIPVYSDCSNAIIAATQPFYISCKSVLSDDTDIRAELRYIYKKVQHYVKISHVKSHQNDTTPLSKLSPAARLNVSLDSYMKKQHAIPTVTHNELIPHLPCQKVSIRNNYDRLTNNFPTSLTRFSIEYEAELLVAKNWKLSQDDMKNVHWPIFARANRTYPRLRQFAVSKFIHNQWPILSREHRWNRSTTPLCPLCSKNNELHDHVFCCDKTHVKTNRMKQLEELDFTFRQHDTFPMLRRHLMNTVRKYTSGYTVQPIAIQNNHPDTACLQAINIQISLSPQNLLRGLLSTAIVDIQQQYISVYRPRTNNVIHWGSKMTKALHTFSTSLWKYRCEIVNNVSQTMMEQHTRLQARKLFQCLQRDPFKLPYENRNLLNKNHNFFSTTKIRNIQSWINRINLALDIQSEKTKVGVSDIRDWLRTAKKEEGKMYFLDDEYEYDSDNTRYHSLHFPDEVDPTHWVAH